MERAARRATRALTLLALAGVLASCGAPERPRNAILVVLDTLRRDALSIYGGSHPTPNLDRLAREGVLFETAVSNSPWTLPAVAGLLGGDYPTAELFDYGLKTSLVERLRNGGWRTAAFTEGGFVSTDYGFDLGFDAFREQRKKPGSRFGEVDRDIARTFAWAREWLESRGDAPFFLLIHTYEAHTPYTRTRFTEGLDPGRLPGEFKVAHSAMVKRGMLTLDPGELEYVRALYAGGAATCDRYVGELRQALEKLGLARSTLLVVTSDHGEDLGEREPPLPGSHGHALYDEQLLVPLILFDPTRNYPVRRVASQVRSIDVMPTILESLGAPVSGERYGRSLLPLLRGEEREERSAWARIGADIEPRNVEDLIAIRAGGHKLIVAAEGSSEELYDLRADPGERADRAAEDDALREALFGELRALRASLEARGVARLHPRADAAPDTDDQLRALGYLE